MKFKVYIKGSGDTADKRIGFTPAPKASPLQVPNSELWYVRPVGPIAGAQIHELADILVESQVPGIDFSNRWDITDETLATLSRCTHLRYLNISRTKVTDTGLATLVELVNLQSFVTTQNMTNSGAASVGGLGRLEELDLDGARITDAGMKSLAALKRLRSLTLSNTRVTDAGLAVLEKLQYIQTLVLGSAISDNAASILATLPSLRSLDISATNMTDRGVQILSSIKSLRSLYTNPQTSDSTLAAIGQIEDLEILDLTSTRVTDAGLGRLAACRDLRELALTRTVVSDAGLKQLSTLRSLRVLELSETKVTPAGLIAIAKNHPKLEAISLSWPHLGGEELDSLAMMKNLRTVVLNGSPMPESVTRHLRTMAKLQRERLKKGPMAPADVQARDILANNPQRQDAMVRSTPKKSVGIIEAQALTSRRPSANFGASSISTPTKSAPVMETLYEGSSPQATAPTGATPVVAMAFPNPTMPLSGLRRIRQVGGEGGALADIQGSASSQIHSEEFTAENSLGEITINSEPEKPQKPAVKKFSPKAQQKAKTRKK